MSSVADWVLVLEADFSSGWISHPLDDPYRLFFNNDAGSSGIAEFHPEFFFRGLCIHLVAYCFLKPKSS